MNMQYVGQTTTTIDCLKTMLEGIVTIVFTKKSTGEQRTIKCTTNLEKIDKQFHPKGTTKNITNATIRVFDLDKNSWRSFYPDSVISITA